MKRACDVTLHLFNFKQLDTFCESTFKLRFSISSSVNGLELQGEPYLLPVGSESILKNKYFITKAFNPQALQNLSLNEMCTFRVEIPYTDDMNADNQQLKKVKSQLIVKVDLLIYGLGNTIFGKRHPPDSEGFSYVGFNDLEISKVWNGVHEYTEVNFHEVIFSTASLAIHSDLVDYGFDVRYLHADLKGFLLFCLFI